MSWSLWDEIKREVDPVGQVQRTLDFSGQLKSELDIRTQIKQSLNPFVPVDGADFIDSVHARRIKEGR